MATVTPRIYTGAYPTITNDIKYALYAASDPLAEVDSQTFTAPHPARAISFPGLDRVNYILRVFEMSGGSPIRTIIDDFNFNPESGGVSYRTPEIIVVDTTVGLVSGASSFTFDGTGGKPDWRGWTPILQPPGFSPWLDGYDYNWDSVTGELTLLGGFTFESGYRILAEFELVTTGAADGVPGGRQFTEVLDITTDTTLTAADLGKKILINPATPYILITMPDIATAVQNRVTWFQTGLDSGTPFCVEIEAVGATEWAFDKSGRTSMYMVAGETFECYKYDNAWQVQNAVGNFLSVGDQFPSDNTVRVGAVLMAGQSGDVEQYARLYNDFVLQLDPSQVVAFADWAANPTKWSYSNGGSPNLFKFPDRRNLHERNTDSSTGIAGVYVPDAILDHQHITQSGGINDLGSDPANKYGKTLLDYFVGIFTGPGTGKRDMTSKPIAAGGTGPTYIGSTENAVKAYRINRFVKI